MWYIPTYQSKVVADLSSVSAVLGHDSESEASCNEDEYGLCKMHSGLDSLQFVLRYSHGGSCMVCGVSRL